MAEKEELLNSSGPFTENKVSAYKHGTLNTKYFNNESLRFLNEPTLSLDKTSKCVINSSVDKSHLIIIATPSYGKSIFFNSNWKTGITALPLHGNGDGGHYGHNHTKIGYAHSCADDGVYSVIESQNKNRFDDMNFDNDTVKNRRSASISIPFISSCGCRSQELK